jgi:hypothetical protein
MRGYRAPTTQPTAKAPAAPPAGEPPEPATSGAPAQPSAPFYGRPTATDVVASIQKGQQAATSLSHAGGTSPDTQLTARALADMSEAEFGRLYNELVAKGDREKLKDLFGH